MTPLAASIAALAIADGIAEREHVHPHRPCLPIRRVIFVVKENRTFDNYFGKFPGADGATSGRISDGRVIPLGPLPDGPQGGSHSWDAALLAYHDGKMDQFDLIPGSMGGERNMVQASERTFPTIGSSREFVLSDNFFSSLHGPSFVVVQASHDDVRQPIGVEVTYRKGLRTAGKIKFSQPDERTPLRLGRRGDQHIAQRQPCENER